MSADQEIYDALAPMHGERWSGDPAPLLALANAIGGMLAPLDDLIRSTPAGPAWSALADSDRIPAEALPWLGQFVGVRVTRGSDPATQRAEILRAAGWGRGTPAAMVAAAQATLTGGQIVVFRERHESPYRVRVITYTSQTPTPATTAAELLAQKPAGILLAHAVLDGQDHYSVRAGNANYRDLRARYQSYRAARADLSPI